MSFNTVSKVVNDHLPKVRKQLEALSQMMMFRG
jgi:hypothetical protein